MRLSKRDIVATVLVALAVALYLLWLVDATLPGMGGMRVTGLVVLALGFAASAVAVVPGFERLLHGDRVYLAVATLLGLVALAGGLTMLLRESSAGLAVLVGAMAVLVGAMAVLWAISTAHHALLRTRSAELTTAAGRGR